MNTIKKIQPGRNVISGTPCTVEEDGDIYWDDGCYRKFHENGHTKESKVITNVGNSKYWYFVFRDENGNIIKEYKGDQI